MFGANIYFGELLAERSGRRRRVANTGLYDQRQRIFGSKYGKF